MICIIHKHHLAVTIGMYKRQKLDAVHLEEKFAHVGTCEGWEKDEFEVDALHVSFHDAQLVFKELEQNVILVQV